MAFSTATTTAKRILQTTANYIIQKGRSLRHTRERENYNEGVKTGDIMKSCKHL